jgi:predicted GNAT family acetyltransferase
MRFNNYKTAAQFSAAVTDTIGRHEIQNNLFYRNIETGLKSADNSNMVMATVTDDRGKILLTVVQTPPNPLLVYATDNKYDEETLSFLAGSLIKKGIELNITMSDKGLAKTLTDIYTGMTGKSFYVHENLVLYTIDKVNELTMPSGYFRRAEPSELYYLSYWAADFIPACHLGDYNLETGRNAAKRLIDEGGLYVWVDKTPVSTAAYVRSTPNCAFIGQVYTPPHLRGKGYSTACVSHLTHKLLNEGFSKCGLYADCANPYSNKVYRKIGYEAVFYYDQYRQNN